MEHDDYIIDKMNKFSKDKVYGVSKMITSMLFDPERPENHTIIKTSERGSGVMIRGDDYEWEYRDFEDIVDVLNTTAEAFMKFYDKYRTEKNIKLVEPKEFQRVKSFAKMLRKLGCTLDDKFEQYLGIYEGSDSEDSADEEKNEKELKKTNKKFEKATLNNFYTNTTTMYKYTDGGIIKK